MNIGTNETFNERNLKLELKFPYKWWWYITERYEQLEAQEYHIHLISTYFILYLSHKWFQLKFLNK